MDSNPGAIYWMDIWTFFTLICCKKCIVCLKRPKINKKRVGPFLKIDLDVLINNLGDLADSDCLELYSQCDQNH